MLAFLTVEGEQILPFFQIWSVWFLGLRDVGVTHTGGNVNLNYVIICNLFLEGSEMNKK